MTRCLAPDCQMGGLGCDNMTVVIVCFLQGGSYEDLAKKCEQTAAPAMEVTDCGDAGGGGGEIEKDQDNNPQ